LAIGCNVIDAAKFEKIMYFIGLSSKNGILITKVNLMEEGVYELITKEGWSIFIGDNIKDLDLAFENLMIWLNEKIRDKRKNLEYINLRFENKIPYKFK
jgi:hypothetical protein